VTRSEPPADPEEPDDATLLAAHVAGEADAFGVLVRRHQDRLWAVALRLVRDRDDAADVLQDALVKAYRGAPGFRGEAAVSTWLHRIVVTTALDLLRRRRPVLPEVGEPVDPVDVAARRDTQLDVAAALAALPPDQRAAVVLVDLQGFAVDEAAAVLGCPPGTVKSRCFRGRARLARLLSDYRVAAGNPAATRGVPSSKEPSSGEGRA
jgi:RNA polymerase sigma-70 factor (ECF subfamily)